MTFDYQLVKLMNLLDDGKYHTLNQLAGEMRISEKTLRKLTKELDEILKENGALLNKKYGQGICLKIENDEAFEGFIQTDSKDTFPVISQQRINSLAYDLLDTDGYVKIDDLADRYFVSRKTISSDLKNVEGLFRRYNLEIERRPHYGMKSAGREFDIRLLLSHLIQSEDSGFQSKLRQRFVSSEIVRDCIEQTVLKCGYTLYESEMSTTVLQIQIMIDRAEHGHPTALSELDRGPYLLEEEDIRVAEQTAIKIQEVLNTEISRSEIKYLAVHMSGKKKIMGSAQSGVMIDMEINKLVNQMLESVERNFQLDLHSDFDLQTNLRQHLVPLRVRLLYHLHLRNPMLREIKENYSFPYAVAAQASTVLSEYFSVVVEEDEIGYLALCFALSIERQKYTRRKSSILLVCASGVGTSKLFEYRFKETFGDYLASVETTDLNQLHHVDLSRFDFIFTTVPVDLDTVIPICQIQYFFDERNIRTVRQLLEENESESIRKYFRPDLFFTEVEGENRTEVLKNICGLIARNYDIPDAFEKSVLEREEIMQTDLCDGVAIPHPYQPMTETTFVATAILKKPVQWQTHEVQIVFLLSISKSKEDLASFYHTAPTFMMDRQLMKGLAQEKSYRRLIQIIEDTENLENNTEK